MMVVPVEVCQPAMFFGSNELSPAHLVVKDDRAPGSNCDNDQTPGSNRDNDMSPGRYHDAEEARSRCVLLTGLPAHFCTTEYMEAILDQTGVTQPVELRPTP